MTRETVHYERSLPAYLLANNNRSMLRASSLNMDVGYRLTMTFSTRMMLQVSKHTELQA